MIIVCKLIVSKYIKCIFLIRVKIKIGKICGTKVLVLLF